jgi:HEAT repeat protein
LATDFIKRLFEVLFSFKTAPAPDRATQLLSTITSATEPRQIFDLLPLLFDNDRVVADEVAATISRLLIASDTDVLALLDVEARVRMSGGHVYRWNHGERVSFEYLESFGAQSPMLLALFSFHCSGYVRQEAIARLARYSTHAGMPFFLLRTADWVPIVSQTAEQIVRLRLSPDYAKVIIRSLPLVYRLQKRSRGKGEQLLHEIEELLKKPEAKMELFNGMTSTNLAVRRACFNLAAGCAMEDVPEILELALGDADTLIRLRAAKRVVSDISMELRPRFVARMMRDRYAPVRLEALRLMAGKKTTSVGDELQSALLDSHPSLREESRRLLSSSGTYDFRGFYRDALKLNKPKALAAAVAGLGETGSRDDAEILLTFVSDQHISIRKAAVQAVSNLSGNEYLAVFMDALKEPAPGVSKQARKALSRRARMLNGDQLWELLSSAAHHHTKINTLSLLSQLPKWDSVTFLLACLCANDPEIAEISRRYIARWLFIFNGSFTTPTAGQIRSFREALDRCGDQLDETTQRALLFVSKDLG